MPPTHRLAGAPLDFAALRSELAVPGEFSVAVLADASAAASSPQLPDDDATDIPFVTIDPAGSRDLDQAVHVRSDPDGGFLVSYAIADVASFVVPGSPLDDESQRRGETLYFPDARVPLHPTVLSEGAASLLPDEVRPAVLWQVALDDRGEVLTVELRRARVKSRAQLDYQTVQRGIGDGSVPPAVAMLPRVGQLRLAIAQARHAIELDLPQQEVTGDAASGWRLELRLPLPIERYNSQISLLTGMCAASIMLDAGVGILRTVPPPDDRVVAMLRRIAPPLGVKWPSGAAPGDVLNGLNRGDPKQAIFLDHAAALLRGSGYIAFDGTPPAEHEHAGVGAPYAHVTAPLRRLVDRYATEICLAYKANSSTPDWVRQRLPGLAETMARADRLAHEVDRAVVDATEAWLLQDRVNQTFAALVLAADDDHATIAIDEPAVRARCLGDHLTVGERITARLVEADVDRREVRFEHFAG